MRPATWVTIEEVAGGAWGIGGNAMHTGDVLGLRSGARTGAPPPIEGVLRSARRLASRRPERSHGSGR
jgi:hypothetical protein